MAQVVLELLIGTYFLIAGALGLMSQRVTVYKHGPAGVSRQPSLRGWRASAAGAVMVVVGVLLLGRVASYLMDR